MDGGNARKCEPAYAWAHLATSGKATSVRVTKFSGAYRSLFDWGYYSDHENKAFRELLDISTIEACQPAELHSAMPLSGTVVLDQPAKSI